MEEVCGLAIPAHGPRVVHRCEPGRVLGQVHGVKFCPGTNIDGVEGWSLVRSACCGRGIKKTETREKTEIRRRRERERERERESEMC